MAASLCLSWEHTVPVAELSINWAGNNTTGATREEGAFQKQLRINS